MSMISGLSNKLRERAKALRQGRWSDGGEDARLMEDAADLILELRDDLQRVNAENDKLRTQLADVTESMGRVEERCAKLRALCRDMYLVVELLDMDGVQLQAHGKDADWRTLKERFGELGVEADA